MRGNFSSVVFTCGAPFRALSEIRKGVTSGLRPTVRKHRSKSLRESYVSLTWLTDCGTPSVFPRQNAVSDVGYTLPDLLSRTPKL